MKRIALAALILSVGCATTTFDKSDGCTQVRDPNAPVGFAVYSCPHPFIVPHLSYNSSAGQGQASVSTTKLASGVTNCVDKTVYFYETYPEVLAHEYHHARLCGTGATMDLDR